MNRRECSSEEYDNWFKHHSNKKGNIVFKLRKNIMRIVFREYTSFDMLALNNYTRLFGGYKASYRLIQMCRNYSYTINEHQYAVYKIIFNSNIVDVNKSIVFEYDLVNFDLEDMYKKLFISLPKIRKITKNEIIVNFVYETILNILEHNLGGE